MARLTMIVLVGPRNFDEILKQTRDDGRKHGSGRKRGKYRNVAKVEQKS